MKNLALVIGILLSGVSYGQNSWIEYRDGVTGEKVIVEGLEPVSIGGSYSITALEINTTAFLEVIEEAKRVLDANGIEWGNQLSSVEAPFKNYSEAYSIYSNAVEDWDGVSIVWLIYSDIHVVTTATISIQFGGFRFEVTSKYI